MVAKKTAKKTSTKKPTARPVIVTTAHRGVFFGYARNTSGESISLERGRNCLYWDVGVKGFVGLASAGPNGKCRVGPPADMELRGITAVLEVSEQAVKAWEAAPWS